MPKYVWQQLGEPTLQTTRATLRGADGEGLGATGELLVRGFIGQIKVQFAAVVARDARPCFLSGTQLRTKGYTFTLNQHESFLKQPNVGARVTMSREGYRDTLKVACMLKPRDAQSVTSLMSKQTGQHENKKENAEGGMTADERITHERTGHATYDPRCETCHVVRRVTTHPCKAVAEAAYFDYATGRKSQQGAEVKIRVGAGPRGETFARAVHHQGATFEYLELFLKVLQTLDKCQCVVIRKSACVKLYTVQPDDWDCQQA